MTRTPCIDGGAIHSWINTGLDVLPIRGVQHLRWTQLCTWCDAERSLPYRPASVPSRPAS